MRAAVPAAKRGGQGDVGWFGELMPGVWDIGLCKLTAKVCESMRGSWWARWGHVWLAVCIAAACVRGPIGYTPMASVVVGLT